MCTPGGTWTCQGNTITVHVDNGVVTQHELQADGRTMVGGCCTITRMGAVPAIAAYSPPVAVGTKQPTKQLPAATAAKLTQPQTPATPTAVPRAQPNADSLRAGMQQQALGCNLSTQEIAGCIDVPSSTNPGVAGAQQPRPSPGVPANVQAQIIQAQSYMQAAQTVKQSDPSYSGWSTAASQFRMAATAFQAAGDLINAAAANDQAQTLETALKIANEKGAQVNRSEIGAVARPGAACSGGDAGYPVSFWQAGNLNQRYGSSWSCNMISLVPQSSCELYNSCLPCMNSNEDFYQDTGNAGHCVARVGVSGKPTKPSQRAPGQPTTASSVLPPFPGIGSPSPLVDPSPGDIRLPPPVLPPGSICDGLICAVAVEYPPPPPPPSGACNWKEAEVNFDWVLQNAGAKATYFMWRGYGMDPVRALIQAQAHNPHAQQTLMNCLSMVANTLLTADPTSPNPQPQPLPARPLSLKDCHCITVLPTGGNNFSGRPEYSVTNSCSDPFMMSITMLGSVGSSKPSLVSNSDHDFLITNGKTTNYSGPDRTILSIYGWSLRNATSKLQCFIPQ
jgi:hypothetical protein